MDKRINFERVWGELGWGGGRFFPGAVIQVVFQAGSDFRVGHRTAG